MERERARGRAGVVAVLWTAVAVAAGALTAVAAVPVLLAALLTRPLRGVDVSTPVLALVRADARRIARTTDAPGPVLGVPTSRAVRYLAARVPVGLLGGAVLAVLGAGVAYAVLVVASWLAGGRWLFDAGVAITGSMVAWYVLPGLLVLYLALSGLAGVAALDRWLLTAVLGPSREDELARQVDELTASRAAIVAAVDEERRRIERDLHDGVQQRLVALGVLIGRARRGTDPDRAAELLAQAHVQARRAGEELRAVAWRVHPAALDEGLAAGLDQVAEHAGVPVAVRCELPGEPPTAQRTAAWFVVSEAVTNAAKHAGASRVDVDVRAEGDVLRVRVVDDGRGGADPSGGGLSGLARRVAAASGTLTVTSPTGGPTTVEAELPCAW